MSRGNRSARRLLSRQRHCPSSCRTDCSATVADLRPVPNKQRTYSTRLLNARQLPLSVGADHMYTYPATLHIVASVRA
eukprot:1844367-Prymnesium_polylepis.1